MREQAASDSPGRLADLAKREAVKLRRDLALEPRLVALARMLARKAALKTLYGVRCFSVLRRCIVSRDVADGHTKKGCVVFADAARRARGSAVAGIKAEG